MKAIPGLVLYWQTYYADREDEVAYCPDCKEYHGELHELLVDTVNDEVNFAFCNECHSSFNGDQILWKDAEKDSENNPPKDSEKYHAILVVQQGHGHWENVKYRTGFPGTVDEVDRLMTLTRKLKPLTAATLINILEKWLGE